jgi:hypothetical protein
MWTIWSITVTAAADLAAFLAAAWTIWSMWAIWPTWSTAALDLAGFSAVMWAIWPIWVSVPHLGHCRQRRR